MNPPDSPHAGSTTSVWLQRDNPVDSFVSVFTEKPLFAVSNVTFLGEFLLGLWLLIRSRHTTLATQSAG